LVVSAKAPDYRPLIRMRADSQPAGLDEPPPLGQVVADDRGIGSEQGVLEPPPKLSDAPAKTVFHDLLLQDSTCRQDANLASKAPSVWTGVVNGIVAVAISSRLLTEGSFPGSAPQRRSGQLRLPIGLAANVSLDGTGRIPPAGDANAANILGM
jgi:hypothetical protein